MGRNKPQLIEIRCYYAIEKKRTSSVEYEKKTHVLLCFLLNVEGTDRGSQKVSEGNCTTANQ